MTPFSIRQIADGIGISPPISLKRDIFGYGGPNTNSLREKLLFIQKDIIAKNVVIVCINGRAGAAGPSGRSGMYGLRDRLKTELAPLGVNQDNIFRISWNKDGDNDPSGAPDLNDINNEIRAKSSNPSYLAIIGHSYGGWAACTLSRITDRIPDFVALIDPVFGPTNTFKPRHRPRGNFIKNWYQTNGVDIIIPSGHCSRSYIPCGPTTNGISCGYRDVPGANENEKVDYYYNWDGNHERYPCPITGRVHIEALHVNMDDNGKTWRQIRNKIYEDLDNL